MSRANKLARTTLVVALASGCALLSALPAHAGFLGAGGAVAGGGALGGVVGGAIGAGSLAGGMGGGGVAGGQRRFEAGSAITGRGEAGASQEMRAPGRRLIDATDNAATQAAARSRSVAGQTQGRVDGAAAAGAQAAQGGQAAGAQAAQGTPAVPGLQGGVLGIAQGRSPETLPGSAPAVNGSTGAAGSTGSTGATGATGATGGAAAPLGSATAAGQVDGQGAVRAERSDGSSGAGVSVQGSGQGSARR